MLHVVKLSAYAIQPQVKLLDAAAAYFVLEVFFFAALALYSLPLIFS